MAKELEKSDEAYDSMAVEAPVREVDMPENEENLAAKSFSDKEDENDDITDMQAVMRKLFPKQSTAEENLAMVGRIYPDVFVPLIDMMSTNEVMMSPDDAKINVAAIHLKHYALLSIGLDGRGRIDALELGGAARDTKLKEGNQGII